MVGHRAKTQGQVIVDVTGWITDAVHDGPVGFVREYGHSLKVSAEPITSGRVFQPCLPPVQRIVIAMAYEGPNARGLQPAQAFNKGTLSAQAAVGAVVDVPGDEQGIHTFGDAKVDDVVIGVERRCVQGLRHRVRGYCPKPRERAVQVKVGGVDESKVHNLPK